MSIRHQPVPVRSRAATLPVLGTLLLLVTILGCAPAGGPAVRDEVVEIETIEALPATDAAPAARPADWEFRLASVDARS